MALFKDKMKKISELLRYFLGKKKKKNNPLVFKIFLIGIDLYNIPEHPLHQVIQGASMFDSSTASGVNFFLKRCNYLGRPIRLVIWNVRFSIRFRSFIPIYLLGTIAVIGVYKVGELESLQNVLDWIKTNAWNKNQDLLVFLIGIKYSHNDKNTQTMESIIKEKIKDNQLFHHVIIQYDKIEEYEQFFQRIPKIILESYNIDF